MLELTATTEIDASAAHVWEALTDLARFREWNPFIRDASGAVNVGAEVCVRVRPSRGPRVTFRPIVVVCDPNHELRWCGHFLAPWLARGDHTFSIEPEGEGRVRFVQRESFDGLLPRLAARLLERETRRGFEAMNRALKARAEAQELRAPSAAGA